MTVNESPGWPMGASGKLPFAAPRSAKMPSVPRSGTVTPEVVKAVVPFFSAYT